MTLARYLPTLGASRLVMLFSAFLVLACNLASWHALASLIQLEGFKRLAFEASFGVFLWSAFTLLFIGFSFRPLLRPVLSMAALGAAGAAYFMNEYGVAIDTVMIQNVVETNPGEVAGLVSLKMVAYLLGLGVVPAVLIWAWPVRYAPPLRGLLHKLATAALAAGLLLATVAAFYSTYGPLLRQHDQLTHFINPTNFIYAGAKLGKERLGLQQHTEIQPIGTDAVQAGQAPRKRLMIFVVGETARADHFSLNGYSRDTNPELSQLDVLDYSQVHSCGTSTAVSVPCMFSMFGRKDYTDKKGKTVESLLDVLQHAGVNVLWVENNSDCKGTCLRSPHRDIPKNQPSPYCDGHTCLDESLLEGLQADIDKLDGDTAIFLHSDGSHGPEYYERYPQAMTRFAPVCHTNQLGSCSNESLNNVYDDTILYTDHFLARVIGVLKANQSRFDTAMWYVSDHGESLGENGLYLHAAPYAIAPEAQKHVPMVLWFGQNTLSDAGVSLPCLAAKRDEADLSHDFVFHSVLGLFNVHTQVYKPALDLFQSCHGLAAAG
ncbi:phosphoethanolamine transferase [Pseudomonas japonica]|uniref:phosphoethanolamine transferase n=1 Tax=Pseudomonas japonica TaxID=256466 RepID=UPI0015E35CAD|nr:phosphoethanolamine--lipid A transferase [Pseudomonas japonica]MBA1245685.1 phosphoethanolamine--lipid A transferase [Pseudomonas japonica]